MKCFISYSSARKKKGSTSFSLSYSEKESHYLRCHLYLRFFLYKEKQSQDQFIVLLLFHTVSNNTSVLYSSLKWQRYHQKENTLWRLLGGLLEINLAISLLSTSLEGNVHEYSLCITNNRSVYYTHKLAHIVLKNEKNRDLILLIFGKCVYYQPWRWVDDCVEMKN